MDIWVNLVALFTYFYYVYRMVDFQLVYVEPRSNKSKQKKSIKRGQIRSEEGKKVKPKNKNKNDLLLFNAQ